MALCAHACAYVCSAVQTVFISSIQFNSCTSIAIPTYVRSLPFKSSMVAILSRLFRLYVLALERRPLVTMGATLLQFTPFISSFIERRAKKKLEEPIFKQRLHTSTFAIEAHADPLTRHRERLEGLDWLESPKTWGKATKAPQKGKSTTQGAGEREGSQRRPMLWSGCWPIRDRKNSVNKTYL